MPGNLIVREIFGIILTVLYMVALPFLSLKTKLGKELYEKSGMIRYYIFIFLFIIMMSLPIKMVLRWLINLKYIVALPEWELNL